MTFVAPHCGPQRFRKEEVRSGTVTRRPGWLWDMLSVAPPIFRGCKLVSICLQHLQCSPVERVASLFVFELDRQDNTEWYNTISEYTISTSLEKVQR